MKELIYRIAVLALCITVIIFFLLGVHRASAAQPVCYYRDIMIEYLKSKYGEAPASFGLTKNGLIFEILASPDGAWTVLLNHPNGQACILASGTDWTAVPIAVEEKES